MKIVRIDSQLLGSPDWGDGLVIDGNVLNMPVIENYILLFPLELIDW